MHPRQAASAASDEYDLGLKSLDDHLAARANLHIQLVALKQCHSNDGLRICLVNRDSSWFVVPDDLSFKNLKLGLAAISERTCNDGFPGPFQCRNQIGWEGEPTVVPSIN